MSTLHQQLLASSLLLTLATTAPGKPADARLVKDLDRRVAPGSISWIESTPNGVVFSMNSRKYGRELWVSDDKGTRLLKDIYPGAWGSTPYPVLVRDGIVYLTCLDKEHGKEIWVTDGTREGTRLHSDIRPGVTSSDTTVLLENQGKLFLFGLSPHGFGLFTADGNGVVSQMLMTLPVDPDAYELPSSPFSRECSFTLGERAYFADGSGHLWESDGTPEGTDKITDFTLPDGKFPTHVAVASGKTVIRVYDNASSATEFWTWSPGGAGPELLMTLPATNHSAAVTTQVLGGKLLIVHSRTLHLTDGTLEGTALIKSFPEGTLVRSVGQKDGHAFLVVSKENSFDLELWKTDGTDQGTLLVKAFNGLTETTTLANFTAAEDRAYFRLMAGETSRERTSSIWITDGTEAGTEEVKQGAKFSAGTQAATYEKHLYFSSADQLWKTGGAPKSTKPVIRSSDGTKWFFEHAESGGILATDRRLFLFSSSYEEEPEGIVAVSGGTAASTRPFWSKQNSQVYSGAVLGSKVLFEDATGIHITNGTARGTQPLFEYRGGEASPSFADTLTIGNTCYMTGSKPGGGRSLWKTDGTRAGTLQIHGAGEPVGVRTLTDLHGTAYYLSMNKELWATDGSTAGTRMIKGGLTGAGPHELITSGNRLYFFTTDNEPGAADGEALHTIWTSDGSEAGTTIAGTIQGKFGMPAGLHGDLIFASSSGGEPWELYRANEAGITKYATLPEGFRIEEGARTSYRSLAVAGGNLYFKCGKPSSIMEDPQYPRWGELWKTDGTAAGTGMVKDIAEGEAGSSPREMIAAGDDIYFAASTPGESLKIWKSDGTEEGTVMIQSKDSEPIFMSDLTLFKSKLFFTAYSPKTGVELHSLALPKAKKKKK